jgi:hypothetical protein
MENYVSKEMWNNFVAHGGISSSEGNLGSFVTQSQLHQAILTVNSGNTFVVNAGTSSNNAYIDPTVYATRAWVTTQLEELVIDGNVNLAGYATQEWVTTQLEELVIDGNVNLAGYATQEWVTTQLDTIESNLQLDLYGYATRDWVGTQLEGLISDGTVIIDLRGYVTTTYAEETYLKKDDLIQDPDTKETVVEYIVNSNVNIFKVGFERVIQADVVTLDDDDISYNFANVVMNEIRFELRNYPTSNINYTFVEPDMNIFIQTPVYPTENTGNIRGSRGENTIYNGLYKIIDTNMNNGYLTLRCTRSNQLSSADDCIGTIVTIKSNNHSYVITTPNANVLGSTQFVLDTDSFEIHHLMTAEYGTIAKQSHDDVDITGGRIQVPMIHVNEIRPCEGQTEISIRLPENTTNASFRVRATQLETTTDVDNDVIFEVDGTGLVSAFQFNSLSDRSLKTNEETITDPIGLVKKLHGKTFDWKDPSRNKHHGHKQYGFIAQEVAAEFPTLVAETLNEHLTVDYAKVVSILVEAVKVIHDAAIAAGLDSSVPPSQPGCQCCCQTYSNSIDTNSPSGAPSSETIVIHKRPIPGDVTTNLISLGNIHKPVSIVTAATTPNDEIEISELFGTGIYLIYTNKGNNTIDGVVSNVGDVVLMKDAPDKALNGVYEITGSQEGSKGMFLQATRHPDFKEFSNIVGSTVVVEPSGFAGRGKGIFNPGHTFVCLYPSNIDAEAFTLNVSLIEFVSLEHQTYGTMSRQDAHNVHITGGTISVPIIHTNEIRPRDTNDVSVYLDDTNHKFSVKNKSGWSMCEINHSGVVTANDFFSPSDERLKTNVSDITNALSLVRKLHGVTFDWKDNSMNDPNHKQFGFIAQEVALHFPTLVHKRSDDKLSVDYAKVVSILVEAVKDLGSMLNL